MTLQWNKPRICGTHIQWHSGKHSDRFKDLTLLFYSLSPLFPAFTGTMCTISSRNYFFFFLRLLEVIFGLSGSIHPTRWCLWHYLICIVYVKKKKRKKKSLSLIAFLWHGETFSTAKQICFYHFSKRRCPQLHCHQVVKSSNLGFRMINTCLTLPSILFLQ